MKKKRVLMPQFSPKRSSSLPYTNSDISALSGLHPGTSQCRKESRGPDKDVVQKTPSLALLYTIVLPDQMLIKSKARSNCRAVVGV